MSGASVDAVIASVQPEAPAEEAPKSIGESQEQQADEPPQADEPKEEPFPKKAVNALNRKERQLGKAKAQLEFERAERTRLLAELESLRAPQPAAKAEGRPDFNTWTGTLDEYQEALTEWKLEQRIKDLTNKQQEERQQGNEQAYYENLYVQSQAKADEFLKVTPDAAELFEEYDDVIEACPDNIYKIFLESGDAPLAAYNLIKAGKLEAVTRMSPAQAAIEIGRALSVVPQPKPVSKAPTPLNAARGAASGGLSVESLSADDLLKTIRKT